MCVNCSLITINGSLKISEKTLFLFSSIHPFLVSFNIFMVLISIWSFKVFSSIKSQVGEFGVDIRIASVICSGSITSISIIFILPQNRGGSTSRSRNVDVLTINVVVLFRSVSPPLDVVVDGEKSRDGREPGSERLQVSENKLEYLNYQNPNSRLFI